MNRFSALFRTGVLLLAVLCGPAYAMGAPATADLPAPLQNYSGKVVYLDFWASWCGPCAQSFPWLQTMQNKYGDRLKIVAVNLDEDRDLASRFLARQRVSFEVIFDPAGKLAEYFQIHAMPYSVVLDSHGSVIEQHGGFFDAKSDQYEEAIRKAIGSP